MSRIMRVFVNLKNSLFESGKRATFMGTDQYGNKYFEKIADSKHNLRAARYIEERKELGPYGSPEVPVEWEAWLRGRRKDPPTEEEIHRNYARMVKTKLKAQELDGKYLNDKEASGEGTEVREITQDITSNTQKVSFPTYEEYETAPGRKYGKDQS